MPLGTRTMTDAAAATLEDQSAASDSMEDNDHHGDPNDERVDQAEAVTEDAGVETTAAPDKWISRFSWARVLAYGVLPGLTLLFALLSGYLKWEESSTGLSREAAAKTVQVATDSTIAMLSYRPDTAERDLTAAANRLTGPFRDDYSKLITDLVIPGAQQKQISAVTTVPAAASVSATENHAVVLVFIDQTTIVGNAAPSTSTSSVRITLDKVDNQWLVSKFEPI